MKTIEITIDPKGETKIKTIGYVGHSCRDGSRFLELALGEKTTEQLTPEFYRNNTQAKNTAQQ